MVSGAACRVQGSAVDRDVGELLLQLQPQPGACFASNAVQQHEQSQPLQPPPHQWQQQPPGFWHAVRDAAIERQKQRAQRSSASSDGLSEQGGRSCSVSAVVSQQGSSFG